MWGSFKVIANNPKDRSSREISKCNNETKTTLERKQNTVIGR